MKLQGRGKGREGHARGQWMGEGRGRERAAALGTGVPRMADVSILVNRSVCVLRSCSTFYIC